MVLNQTFGRAKGTNSKREREREKERKKEKNKQKKKNRKFHLYLHSLAQNNNSNNKIPLKNKYPRDSKQKESDQQLLFLLKKLSILCY